jgi:isopenicillin N synthase-like dioxygenase
MSDLPVININGLFHDRQVSSIDESVRHALAMAGGFVVTGFPGAGILEARAVRLLKFFDLPEGQKVDIGTGRTNPTSGHLYRGYTSLLDGDDFARTEWFDIGPGLPVAIPPVRGAHVLAEPNLWPETEPYAGWRMDMEAYYADLRATAIAIMLSAGRVSGVNPDQLKDGFADGNSTLRLLHYPAPEAADAMNDAPSLAAERHTDGSGISLLWQAGPGLQAEGVDGVWRDVPQLPGSISVHLGDVLEMMTSGSIRATPHRVIDHGGERWSIGFFLEPSPCASMTGDDRIEDTYGWRLLERLHSYPSMKGLVPRPSMDQ